MVLQSNCLTFKMGPSTFTVNYSSKKFILIGLLDFFFFLFDLKTNKLRKKYNCILKNLNTQKVVYKLSKLNKPVLLVPFHLVRNIALFGNNSISLICCMLIPCMCQFSSKWNPLSTNIKEARAITKISVIGPKWTIRFPSHYELL